MEFLHTSDCHSLEQCPVVPSPLPGPPLTPPPSQLPIIYQLRSRFSSPSPVDPSDGVILCCRCCPAGRRRTRFSSIAGFCPLEARRVSPPPQGQSKMSPDMGKCLRNGVGKNCPVENRGFEVTLASSGSLG